MIKQAWFPVAKRGKPHAVLMIDNLANGTFFHYDRTWYHIAYDVKYYGQFNNARYISEEDHMAIVALMDVKQKKDPLFFYKYGEAMIKAAEECLAFTKEAMKIDWQKSSNEEMAKNIETVCHFMAKMYGGIPIYGYYFYFNDILVDNFLKGLKAKLGEKFDQAVQWILLSEKESQIAHEQHDLLLLAKDSLLQGSIAKSQLETHWKKYAYLKQWYFWVGGYVIGEMENRLKEAMKKGLPAIEAELSKKAGNIDTSLFSQEEMQLIKSMKKMSFALQNADETVGFCIYSLKGLFDEASKRLEVNYTELVSMMLEEIVGCLRAGKLIVPYVELRQRIVPQAVLYDHGKGRAMIGKELEEFVKLNIQEESITVNVLQGSVANKGGVIKGNVRVITDPEQIPAFLEGEILVTPMTNPSYVPAMKKAKAIITDEGGLLCHAAIVSRELGVPCIIGTKIASKALKTGDVVEVEAAQGIIRRL